VDGGSQRPLEPDRDVDRQLVTGGYVGAGELEGAEVSVGGSCGALQHRAADAHRQGADLVTVAVPVPGTDDLVVDICAGPGADRVRGLVLPGGATLAGKVYSAGETVVVEDAGADPRVSAGGGVYEGMGAAFMLPLGTGDHVRGVLQVFAHAGRPVFSEGTVDMVAGFAGHAGLALEIADRRRDAELIAGFQDRDRIARDLHDVAIQRLFASGMTLQGVARMVDRDDAVDLIMRTVDDLDETIRLIRSTIFSLKARDHTRSSGLRSRVLKIADEAAGSLGFAPTLRMEGLLDTVVPEDLADDAVAVLREALSNTARHAEATKVEVSLDATTTELLVTVDDNGIGIPEEPERRSGLANLSERARQRGGAFHATLRSDTPGTTLCWRAPYNDSGN
jgi:signal transduction histidine kinase